MAKLVVNQEKITNKKELIKICPFGALEINDGKVEINGACKMCKLCVKKGPKGAIEYIEEEVKSIDKDLWKGISVYVDHVNGKIHPVTYELIGKARELAAKINHPVYCVFIGHNISEEANELLHYGVNKVFIYDDEELKDFRIEPYAAAFEDFIKNVKPSSILVGATTIGRSLAPRMAARFRTGLTADCTILDIKEDTDLVQIRPAFGGNIMAQIVTPNSRPQLATVRYKVMTAPERTDDVNGEIIKCDIKKDKLKSGINVLEIKEKNTEVGISDAEVIVAAGRGIKSEKDLAMIKEFAELLGAEFACTRPLIESGWVDAKRQIGLSGRTVRPRLIITCGISGAVQFSAGMNNSEHIFAINNDDKAPIFKVAHYGVVGNIYEIIPQLIEKIKMSKEA
ncbi:electron transfer flavoprotein subunit alpha/FixB family protein [Clostridium botulinum]|uniref:electron transfer flavoprotein subunit alpha/FixB family protein n=1 Tax=Clostridium botulinum TaxID=1491 RepID=UPI0013CC516D|nr:electron transfer flavoprotein subunit alpha/FixB family protein [Clostridium botulinum]MBY6810768.1 electron transfer flavoprotein subunit alpha [Clostridium botulinum]MBY6824237.1 electron transfer flavoprotein subunit alpha [Clostridium botulinum]MBY6834691.1 electron transfer flavoprotein subunit alpha [Clostridium botulinum]MBY6973403.1 electron transfer flavoprotein subunit alpha [Clostridium botulinum]MCS6104419.1 electron transfer flavoprotein subunit alpha [Clostridium botulinum]